MVGWMDGWMGGWMDEGMVSGQETLFPLSSCSCG